MKPSDAGKHTPRRKLTALLSAGAAVGAVGGVASAVALRKLNAVSRHLPTTLRELRSGASNPLFDAYPVLADRIPWRPLGNFPTPIEPLPPLPDAPEVLLFVKRDDLSSPRYGGNKVRKLEHFLADAQLRGRDRLITLGGIGSNHALATAKHGRDLGFSVDLALYRQPLTPAVRNNVGALLAAGAQLYDAGSIPRAFALCGQVYRRRARAGHGPYFIMVGGTARLGCIGHVTAALELAQQVEQGVMPEPDRIFVPLGTCGTAAGLIAGLKIAGLRSRVAAVRVADPFPANRTVLRYLAQDVADFLARCDPAVPRLHIRSDDFDVITEHLGEGYGIPTAAGERAVRWAGSRLVLDTTYSGKALAALLDTARERPGGTILFWNTFNSAALEVPDDWSNLPSDLAWVLPT